MRYRENLKNGDQISQLGFGLMRLPRKGALIDIEKSTALFKHAVDAGVNYFDTAYIYPGSETVLGKMLASTGLRDKIKIATKLPIYFCKSNSDFDKLFGKQLERIGTDRIDYYLIHMLSDMQSWERLKRYGIIDWILRKKEEGRIINIGFSYHGGKDEFKKLIDGYDWDFCMIQYNYLDENNQAGREGLVYASGKGLPVFVMEPLRGGMLANGLPQSAKDIFTADDNGQTMAERSFRWLLDQPEVTMVLSGMGAMDQLGENLRIADNMQAGTLTEADREVYDRVLQAINSVIKVPCTGCGYCMPCPAGVDIPTCFSCYNESFSNSKKSARHRYFMSTGPVSAKQSYASKCVKCKKCEAHCPQKIQISGRLPEVSKRMEPFWFRGATTAARKFMRIK